MVIIICNGTINSSFPFIMPPFLFPTDFFFFFLMVDGNGNKWDIMFMCIMYIHNIHKTLHFLLLVDCKNKEKSNSYKIILLYWTLRRALVVINEPLYTPSSPPSSVRNKNVRKVILTCWRKWEKIFTVSISNWTWKDEASWWWRWWWGMEKEIFMSSLSICYIGCLSVWVGLTQSVWLLNRRRWINFFPEKYKIRKHLKTILKYLCFVYKMHNKNNNMNIYFIMCVIIVIAIHLLSNFDIHSARSFAFF